MFGVKDDWFRGDRGWVGALCLMSWLSTPWQTQADQDGLLRVPGPSTESPLACLHHRQAIGQRLGVVIFIHGATFPSELASGFRFEEGSWLDFMAEAGFDSWALDFPGYGASDRYPQMSEPAAGQAPLGRVADVVPYIDRAVELILGETAAQRVSVIAHSWGTIPASRWSTQHPDRVEHLVLFGPVVPRDGDKPEPVTNAYNELTGSEQLARFRGYLPSGRSPVLEEPAMARWAESYRRSDPANKIPAQQRVRVPSGPVADLLETWSGQWLYDPKRLTAPTLLIQGEWDSVTGWRDVEKLYGALTQARRKRTVTLGRGTHIMHLERFRRELYREVLHFLTEPAYEAGPRD